MFFGREKELKILKDFNERSSGSLLVYGKRKVGKTTLIKEGFKYTNKQAVYFQADKVIYKQNVNEFANALYDNGVLPIKAEFSSFKEIFKALQNLKVEALIVIDEYPYIKEKYDSKALDSEFQDIIDNYMKNISLIISGSHIKMMTDLLNESNALFGRFDETIKLVELNYKEASLFYPNVSLMDKIAYYSIFGGSPFACLFINPNKTIKENIISSYLNTNSAFFIYASHMLLSDMPKSANAESICSYLGNGKKKYSEIANKLGFDKNGELTKKIEILRDMNVIKKVYPINDSKNEKRSFYVINDNVLRFFYTFIAPNISKLEIIDKEVFYDAYIEPALKHFVSNRFEEIARQYFSLQSIEKKDYTIIDVGTYYYDNSITKQNGEFDVAIKYNDLSYKLVEVKYYKNKLSLAEMNEEVLQISKIKTSNKIKISFLATSGYEDNNYDCIDPSELYE